MTLLSPSGLVLALAVALPLAALVLALRRVDRVRAGLRLPAPRGGRERAQGAALAAAVALLALATAQPARTTTEKRQVRTDAQAFLVVDISRSMLAAPPGGPTRLARGKAEALELARSLRNVPLHPSALLDVARPLVSMQSRSR